MLTESDLPQLDASGYPLYYCPTCNVSFSSAARTRLEGQQKTQMTRQDEVKE